MNAFKNGFLIMFLLYQTYGLPYTTKLEPISNKILTLTNEFRHATASAPPSTRSVLGSASAVSHPPSPHRLFMLPLFCAGFLFFGMGGWSRAGFSLKGETGGILSANFTLGVLPRVYHILEFVYCLGHCSLVLRPWVHPRQSQIVRRMSNISISLTRIQSTHYQPT